MDERAALARLADRLPHAGDDCAVVDGQVLTTDMLHASTDFPGGTTAYTAGWRAVGASLSDVAAMGARPTAAVAVYGDVDFGPDALDAVVDGATDVCESVGAEYVGGDLDRTGERTLATTALGEATHPIRRSGASVGDAVCVTGSLGRSAAGLRLFDRGRVDRANDLFQFDPRVPAGRALAAHATAMMDSSDGLARSAHTIAKASDVGIALETPLPIDEAVDAVTTEAAERQELGLTFGEDFELVCTLPEAAVADARAALSVPLTRVGDVVESRVTLDGEPLANRGYTH
jgi:thiamine-monophosphate kinase